MDGVILEVVEGVALQFMSCRSRGSWDACMDKLRVRPGMSEVLLLSSSDEDGGSFVLG